MKTSANKTQTPIYCIDDINIEGDEIAFDYTLNDQWLSINLSYTDLKQFALNHGLNDYCFDYMRGEHVQDHGSYDIDTFLSENLKSVILAYLQQYPLESTVSKLVALMAILDGGKEFGHAA